ncbi:MAG: tRNA uridine-5-carboxymethylaminomethyl(34) synthesis enzyme MnmG, partial [FCB group bacterium]|nr:tRNA uridine-5-carboxymethylaminomethyl(34) synthesis enzyme MnmG [FCB group bacterium]
INGTSGYEEAAAQGLMAGVNAVLYIEKEPPFILDRSEAYTGVMIDDLTTHTITEPYRLFTSRAEYRLALREDNARDRLYKYAKEYDLISATDYDSFYRLQRETEKEIKIWQKKRIDVASLGVWGKRFKKRNNISLAELLKQPGVTIKNIMPLLSKFNGDISDNNDVLERVAIIIRYQGYIEKQQREIEKFRKMEQEVIPDNFSYDTIKGLKNEALEKLRRFHPRSLGQAGRLEGVTPGDVAVLSVYLKKNRIAHQ